MRSVPIRSPPSIAPARRLSYPTRGTLHPHGYLLGLAFLRWEPRVWGVAAAHGFEDASRSGRIATVALTDDLTNASLERFVTVDLEDGFADDPSEVADLVQRISVDGINLEDSTCGQLVNPELHARKIAAVKHATPSEFVNARTDVFWLGGTDFDEAMTRLRRYVHAGADGIFLPGTDDPHIIEMVATSIDAPLDVLASPARTRGRFGELASASASAHRLT